MRKDAPESSNAKEKQNSQKNVAEEDVTNRSDVHKVPDKSITPTTGTAIVATGTFALAPSSLPLKPVQAQNLPPAPPQITYQMMMAGS